MKRTRRRRKKERTKEYENGYLTLHVLQHTYETLTPQSKLLNNRTTTGRGKINSINYLEIDTFFFFLRKNEGGKEEDEHKKLEDTYARMEKENRFSYIRMLRMNVFVAFQALM